MLLEITPTPTPHRSSYLAAVTLEIERKLQHALESPTGRRNCLQELFADIALEVDNRARDIIFNKTGDSSTTIEDEAKNRSCFYDVLADHYVLVPESGSHILSSIVQLWSQSFASHIFALLFHKWLFERQLESTDVLLRCSYALIEGSTNVFWIDIQTNEKRFLSLFYYLFEEVALVSTRLNKIPLQVQRDLFLLLSRFIIFYDLVDRVQILLEFPVFPNAFFVGSAADIFVIEVTHQLQKLKVEPVLLHYLRHMKCLEGLELRMTTSTRLKTCLYSFTSPGGPLFPTRAVRHAAWDSLNLLFPVGRYPRHVISMFFRLLYPWYWPSSCWNFIITISSSFFFSIFPNWIKHNH